jgi:hypothetical protein
MFPSREHQFKPGVSGNPKGRPPKKPITEKLAAAMEAVGDDGRSMAERVAQRLVEMCLAGDLAALREVLDRLEGKVTLPLAAELSGSVEVPVARPDEKTVASALEILEGMGYIWNKNRRKPVAEPDGELAYRESAAPPSEPFVTAPPEPPAPVLPPPAIIELPPTVKPVVPPPGRYKDRTIGPPPPRYSDRDRDADGLHFGDRGESTRGAW